MLRRRKLSMALVPAAVLLAGLAFAQQPGGGSNQPPAGGTQPGGGAGAGAGSIPGTVPGTIPGRNIPAPTPQDRLPQQRFPEEQRPVFLSGRVMLDDGGAPVDSAVIESVCSGTPRAEGYTDSKGRFSFQLGNKNSAVIQDASVGGASGPFGSPYGTTSASNSPYSAFGNAERLLMTCELRARLPGYRSDVINLSNHRALDSPDVGTIVLHRLAKVEGRVISAKSLAAPKDARKAFEKGVESAKKGKLEDARKNLEKALSIYPDYPTALCELGKVHMALKQPDEARRSFEAAMQSDSKYLEPYMQIAGIQASARQWKELVATTDQLLRLDPFGSPLAYFLNAVANYNVQNFEAAEKSAREAEKIDTSRQIPKTWQLLGIILANRKQYAEAAVQMKNYLEFAPRAADADAVRAQVGQLEKLSLGAPAR